VWLAGDAYRGDMAVPTARHDAKCPVRPGDPCSLCWPGATGPADCGLVYLARNDPELWDQRSELLRRQKKA